MFDLIYHQDVSCYMSDYEICLLNENVFNNLKKTYLYISIIEQDLKLKKKYSAFLEIKKNYIKNPFHEKDNPINFKSLKKFLNYLRKII